MDPIDAVPDDAPTDVPSMLAGSSTRRCRRDQKSGKIGSIARQRSRLLTARW
jgi:hypothetical protein